MSSPDDIAAALHELTGPMVSENDQTLPPGQRPCPICGQCMRLEAHGSVNVDVCPAHGLWLDNGELGAILSRNTTTRTVSVRRRIQQPKRDGKVSGALFGVWSLLWDWPPGSLLQVAFGVYGPDGEESPPSRPRTKRTLSARGRS